MSNCKNTCSNCELELSAKLCEIPSKWRDQIVSVLCNTIDGYGIECKDVLTCLNNELDTLDYSCITNSSATWEAYSFLQKMQVIIAKACETLASPEFVLTSASLVVTPGGTLGHNPNIEIQPSSDSNNSFILGTDGYPYVPTSLSTPLIATDSNSIDFTTSGTLNHNLTAIVRLNPSNNLITVDADGLLVPSSSVEKPLTFNNGLTRTSNLVQLGGDLVKDTIVSTLGYTFNLNHANFDFNLFSSDVMKLYKQSSTYSIVQVQAKDYWNTQVSNHTDYNGAVGFYTKGFTEVKSSRAITGYAVPTTNSLINPAPGNSTKLTSYSEYTGGNILNYANKQSMFSPYTQVTSGALVNNRRYRIIDNSGGASFTSSGSLSNAEGTYFYANTTAPNWGTGGAILELIGDISLSAPAAVLQVTRSNISEIVTSEGTVAPSDVAALTILNPGYYEIQTYTIAQRNLIGYYVDCNIQMHSNNGSSPSDTRYVTIGVNVPVTTDVNIAAAPTETSFTCYTSWLNFPAQATPNRIHNVAPVAVFIGANDNTNTKVGINTIAPTNVLDIEQIGLVTKPSLRIRDKFTPLSATATGTTGEITWDDNYVYICINTNVWKRSPLTTW